MICVLKKLDLVRFEIRRVFALKQIFDFENRLSKKIEREKREQN